MLRSGFPQLTRAVGWRLKSTKPAAFESLQNGFEELDSEHRQFHIPYARSKNGPFVFDPPQLGNQYLEDVTLRNYLKRFMPEKVFTEISPDLERFGHRVATDIYELGQECERVQPELVQYDAWGKRIDNIITCDAWKQMKRISAEEGLIAIAYERKYQEWSRLYQLAKLYLYAPSAGLFSCPLAMTDGAAKSLEVIGDKQLMDTAYTHVTSRDPAHFWTSGQWMTEKKGGSDVGSGTETLAIPQPDGSYRLYGYKWFTSATDADMCLTLARIVDSNAQYIQGTKGVSMFYLEVRDEEGNLNNIQIQRLKDKLGTRQLPTGEMLLDGVRAVKVSKDGRGVASITNMLTMTRIHNALSAAGGMRRIINLARDYSTKRECFGQTIKDYKLHIKNLANMEIEARGALLLVLELGRYLGLEDCKKATEHESNLLRLLTPVAKLYTAKQAVAVASEGLECFGGMGYLEDTGLPVHLRDAQTLPIWEGTTNILSLDVLRALMKTHGEVLQSFHKDVHQRSAPAQNIPQLKDSAERVRKAADQIVWFAQQHMDKLEIAARDFAYGLARTYMGTLLLEHASSEGSTAQDIYAAKRWCEKDLTPMLPEQQYGNYEDGVCDTEFGLVYAGYVPTTGSRM